MPDSQKTKNIIITGAAQRIGAQTARNLHALGMNILLHFHNSKSAAESLSKEFNQARNNSALLFQADLKEISSYDKLVKTAVDHWGSLDALINNASSFYPTPIGQIKETDWDTLMASNLKAPLFLSQSAAPYLKKSNGCIINIIDIHAEKPMREHTVYSIAKAGLAALTKSLAKELAPEIRVNGVAPGAILWPEAELDTATKSSIIDRIALKQTGQPSDIANTVAFLIQNAPYITGQIINVDGGRSLNM